MLQLWGSEERLICRWWRWLWGRGVWWLNEEVMSESDAGCWCRFSAHILVRVIFHLGRHASPSSGPASHQPPSPLSILKLRVGSSAPALMRGHPPPSHIFQEAFQTLMPGRLPAIRLLGFPPSPVLTPAWSALHLAAARLCGSGDGGGCSHLEEAENHINSHHLPLI